jgi:DNA-binding LacI/PurR family transcriptional regulator
MDVARDEFGIVVPDELSIIGFDNIEQASWIAYNLTTFSQPLGAIAEHIASLLVAGGSSAAANETVSFHPVPVWRRSVRPRMPRSGE